MIFLFSMSAYSGEIDGKGIICLVYGDTIGYFFDNDRAFEYKIAGGEKGLEVVKKDVGKYYTNENSIFINECKAYGNFDSFKEGFDIDKLIKDNKI